MPRVHELKTWPDYFQAIASGVKGYELRFNDRGYVVGDILLLKEYDITTDHYTGDELRVEVTYIYNAAEGDNFGLAPGWCVMSIKPVSPSQMTGESI